MSFIIIIFIFTHLGFQAGSTEGKHGHHHHHPCPCEHSVRVCGEEIWAIIIIILAHMGGCWRTLRSPSRLIHTGH